jgi:hypothetical protein
VAVNPDAIPIFVIVNIVAVEELLRHILARVPNLQV